MSARNPATSVFAFVPADLWEFVGVLSILTTENGINVHFGTNTKDEADFMLIFTSSGEKCLDFGDDYFLLDKKGILTKIEKKTADEHLKNYSEGIRKNLDKGRQATNTYPDTDYVNFDKNRINEILAEIKYYYKLKKIDGISINITSYTDDDGYSSGSEWIKSKYQDRLTIQFGYLGKGNQATSLQAIDAERHQDTIESQGLVTRSGYDTGLPVPPPVGMPG